MNIDLLEQWIETKLTQIGSVPRNSPRYDYKVGQKHLLNELSKFVDENSDAEKINEGRAATSMNNPDFIDHLAEAVAIRITGRLGTEINGEQSLQDELTELGSNKLIGSAEVIDKLNISYTTLWRLIKTKEIPAPRKIGRLNRWLESDIENYLSLFLPNVHTINKTKD